MPANPRAVRRGCVVNDDQILESVTDLPEVHTIAKRAREWIDVHAARTCPGTTYIPRTGDRRYV